MRFGFSRIHASPGCRPGWFSTPVDEDVDRTRSGAADGISQSGRNGRKEGGAVADQVHEDAATIWRECLGSLDQAAGSTHRAWLAQTRAVSVVGDTLVLAVPDEFVKDWVEQRYAPNVLGTLARVAGRPLAIRVTVRELDDSFG